MIRTRHRHAVIDMTHDAGFKWCQTCDVVWVWQRSRLTRRLRLVVVDA